MSQVREMRNGTLLPASAVRYSLLAVVALLLLASCASTPSRQWPASPSQLYGALFNDVQMARVFPDSKTFADAVAKRDPRDIVLAYEREHTAPTFDLRAFVHREFDAADSRRLGVPHLAGRRRANAHRSFMVGAGSGSGSAERPFQRPEAAASLRGAWRPVYRDVLLGLVLHHARSGGEWPTRSGRDMCDNFAFLVRRATVTFPMALAPTT